MKRPILSWLLGAALTFIAYWTLNDRPALALTIVSSPFGNTPVEVRIGSCGNAPCQVVVWHPQNGACQFTIIGNGTGLTDDIQVHGGGGVDALHIISGQTTCPGWNLGPLSYNGHYLDLYGDGGDDEVLNSQGTGDTHLHGGDGNDLLDVLFLTGSLFGEGGDDKLYSHGTFSNEVFFGGAGNDCIQDNSGAAAVIDCGSGSDKIVRTASGVVPANVNCESISNNSC
jgi:hypothetical protein